MGTAGFEEGFGVFEMTKVMGPVAIVQVIFWGTIGYTLLEKVLKPVARILIRTMPSQIRNCYPQKIRKMYRHGREPYH